jgi:ribosomal protein S18 acetylase RimI-like enzyme
MWRVREKLMHRARFSENGSRQSRPQAAIQSLPDEPAVSVLFAPAAAAERQVSIRPCTKDDVSEIAAIHKRRFTQQGYILTQLSPSLIATLYASYLGRSVFLVHTTAGKIDGFVLGGNSRVLMDCRFSFLHKHWLFCARHIAFQPRLWVRSLLTLAKLAKSRLWSMRSGPAREEFRLLSIAVDGDASRKGVGGELVEAFEAAISGIARTYKLNVLKSNLSAIRFYEKLSFQRVAETSLSWTLGKDMHAAAKVTSPFGRRRAA